MVIGWKSQRDETQDSAELKSFDDFELRLGDLMRGERATLGKSLLDVQRDLRIKASYIAAIENCDPEVFETPGFIAGYVRSYARYLNLDPDETFAAFCAESGFSTAHGMSDKASGKKPIPAKGLSIEKRSKDPLLDPKLPFTPEREGFLSRIEPGAVGSTFVLLALIGGIGYGGWSVLQEVQRVQVAPVEQTPIVLSDLDPLDTATAEPTGDAAPVDVASGVFTPPQRDVMDRLYRPQALDVPVLVARDAPISTLDPKAMGVFANAVPVPELPSVDTNPGAFQLAGFDPEVLTLVAARPAWVRIRDAQGSVMFDNVMQPGQTWVLPKDMQGASLSVGESGALYFAMNGETFGPIGPNGSVTTDLELDQTVLAAAYRPAKLGSDEALTQVLADLGAAEGVPTQPKVLQDSAQGVMMIAVRPAWVRVRSADGTVIYEATLNAGDTWTAPATEEPATLRVGESGAIYFAVNGRAYGPAGPSGTVTKNIALGPTDLTQSYQVADIASDGDLQRVLAELNVAEATVTD
jgi:hypothetical protein